MFDSPDEVSEPCDPQPEGLDAGFAVALPAEEAAEHGDLPDHLAEDCVWNGPSSRQAFP